MCVITVPIPSDLELLKSSRFKTCSQKSTTTRGTRLSEEGTGFVFWWLLKLTMVSAPKLVSESSGASAADRQELSTAKTRTRAGNGKAKGVQQLIAEGV